MDEAHQDTNVCDISQPHLVQLVDNHPLDKIGIPAEAVAPICDPYPLSLNLAEKVALMHQPQHLIVIYLLPFMLELIRDPAIPILGKLKADGLDAVS